MINYNVYTLQLLQSMKSLLDQWEQKSPGRREVMFRALQNVRPSHLADERIWDFEGLNARE
ncbi:MAG: hypothetical protein MI892_27500 [Desulfobacterales bacterium]|nr:hypothetical protein [Desulfobacterales bacterium]